VNLKFKKKTSKVELKAKGRTEKFSSHRCNHCRVIANFSIAIIVQYILNSNLLQVLGDELTSILSNMFLSLNSKH
jgi:hypothetical protein